MQNPATISDLELIFSRIISLATQFAVLTVFVMLIIGGFKYLTSGGDAKATESAQKTLTYAFLGFISLIVIWLILRFIHAFTGIDVTQFRIGD